MKFAQKIGIIGVNPYVIPPEEILEELFRQSGKTTGAIPVKGKINGKAYIQTLVKYKGAWRLYINGIMRESAGVDIGDIAEIEIFFDPSSREIPMHPLFKTVLSQNPDAKKVFETYSPSRQKEINRYLNNMKSEASLFRNIDRVIRHMQGDKTVGYFVLMDRSPKNYRNSS